MPNNLTQPEEIELALMEMAKYDDAEENDTERSATSANVPPGKRNTGEAYSRSQL